MEKFTRVIYGIRRTRIFSLDAVMPVSTLQVQLILVYYYFFHEFNFGLQIESNCDSYIDWFAFDCVYLLISLITCRGWWKNSSRSIFVNRNQWRLKSTENRGKVLNGLWYWFVDYAILLIKYIWVQLQGG